MKKDVDVLTDGIGSEAYLHVDRRPRLRRAIGSSITLPSSPLEQGFDSIALIIICITPGNLGAFCAPTSRDSGLGASGLDFWL